MNILRLIGSLHPAGGGPVESLIQSSACQAEMGVKTTVVVCDSPGALWLKDACLKHLEIVAIGKGRYGWSYHPSLIPWLRANIERFDDVLVHGLWLFHGYATKTVVNEIRASGRKINFSILPHGTLDPWFQSWRRRPFKTMRNIFYWHIIEKQILRSATQVFYTCEQERRLARTTFSGYQCREVVIPYGTRPPPSFIPTMQHSFKEKCCGFDQPYLLFLSRIDSKKGVALLLKAYARYLDQAITIGQQITHLVIAGPGMERSYGQEIRTLAESLPRDFDGQNYIHFPGMLQGDAKWGAFYGCDAFILPSHQENFGIVVAEALACGKPVLISNQVNIWREIKEAGAGIIEADTEEGCYQLLVKWFKLSESQKESLRNQARPCFEKKFRVEASARAIIENFSNSRNCGCSN